MKRYTVYPVKGLKGTITVQGDKSISHRAAIIGSIALGVTRIYNFLLSEDCLKTLDAFRQMGVSIKIKKDEVVEIQGRGLKGLKEPSNVIDLGNSGTGARLITGVLSAQPFFSVITGDDSLRRRPMERIVNPLRMMGASIWGRSYGRYLPLAIRGGTLRGITWDMIIPSAQVKSAILLAGLYARGDTIVREKIPSRDHTERMLEYFGVNIQRGEEIIIRGASEPVSRDVKVPGDISSAAFFIVGATITEDSEVIIKNVGLNPTRTGFIDILREMGARIEILNMSNTGFEPYGDLKVCSSSLKGIRIGGGIIPRLIDEIPVLCIAAAMAEGETIIRDAAELRVKESDRIGVMAECLTRMGVEVEVFQDGMRIKGTGRLKGSRVMSHGDHRIAMAMVIAGLVAEGETVVEDVACINTSFPAFFTTLEGLIKNK